MARTIFFSWQADTPTRVGRNFLKEVLEEVCHKIASDTNVDEAIRDVEVDSDTQGVAGQPPIVATILKKIEDSAVFVADMTFTGTRIDGRLIPNPNVLIEYGWALKSLGHERIICVMNTAQGEPTGENLPFNLKHVRWPIPFSLPENVTPEIKAKEKEKLIIILEKAIRASLATVAPIVSETPPKFPEAKTKGEPGRFRNKEEALGFKDDFFDGTNEKIFLPSGPAMWLRLMPLSNLGKLWTTHELKKVALLPNSNFSPIISPAGGYSYLRAADGIGIFHVISNSKKDPKPTSIIVESVVFVFNTGEIWSIDTSYMTYDMTKLYSIEKYFTESIKRYAVFLGMLGIEPPYKWIAGITGTEGRHYNYPVQEGYNRVGPGPLCAVNTIEADGQYDGKTSSTTALLPFFEKIFDNCGLPRPDYLPK